MKLRHKILLGSSLLAVLPVLVTGGLVSTMSTQLAQESLVDQTREQLNTIGELKSEQLTEYVGLVERQLRAYSRDPGLVTGLRDLGEGYRAVSANGAIEAEQRQLVSEYYRDSFLRELRRRGGDQLDTGPLLSSLSEAGLALQYHYMVANDSPAGFRQELDAATDGSAFSEAHALHHPRIRDFLDGAARTGGYEDLLLVDAESGEVVYSVGKYMDFATSLTDGPFAETAIGDAYRRAISAPSPDDVVFSDFQAYVPAFGAPSAFMASPVYDGTEVAGVMIARLSASRINDIMTSNAAWRRVGLRETGETYLVGGDGTLRNNSRFLVEQAPEYLQALRNVGVGAGVVDRIEAVNSSVLLQPVNTSAAEAALAGRSGFAQATDYRGEAVFTAFAPITVGGVTWGLISQFDESEALAPVFALRDSVVAGSAAVGLVLLVLGGAAGWLFTRTVSRPVQHLENTVRQVAAGDDSARARMTTGDELQTLGDAFDSLLDERISQYEAAARENEQLNNSVIELLRAVSQLSQQDLTVKVPVTEDVTGPVADALNQMVSEIGDLLNDASFVAERVGLASRRLKLQADKVRQMAQDEGVEVDAMAAELDEAARTMAEIAELAERCDQAAAQASETTGTALETVNGTVQGMSLIRELVHETEKRIKRLGERSQEISGIVDIINTIAERTHVLALNASMQAAAAGEAGRGFAVVADEVQRLAESSRNATSQISGLVHNIQVETADTITTMGRTISEVVEGSRMAERAGEQMLLTQRTTSELVEAVQEIASGSQRQSKVSLLLQQKAANVQLSTQKTRQRLEEQTIQTKALVLNSNNLLESIRTFKLPERAIEQAPVEAQPLVAAGGEGHARSSGT
ncbi:methyl-accepting chemotaxis protein [Natronocella acetinitrilica]|uniref:Methyl-accepting chemotaxis protein n=1 Tax=Natronocella acetinitrilica TaxID=414046 RepID=A0AAE3KC15_9GAMM|nr:methyl-accepting chemotaxis protein [Natronocella acetinitrilica]MCP1675231.1 methyl-accepting chemotaxis protein [Natronocella acetinitrilica]